MGFKLVRVDAVEPRKVLLPLGSHFIGRGKLLDCNDHRVSRKHAELTVTSDSILLISLHQNPCFLKKKSSEETIVFCQPDSHILSNGDQFGLTPDCYWFEVISCLEDSPTDIPENVHTDQNVNKQNGDEELTMNENSNTNSYYNEEQESNAFEGLESPSSPGNTSSPENRAETGSKLLAVDQLQDMDTTSTNQGVETTNQLTNSSEEPVEPTDQVTAGKRLHSEESSPCEPKKIKTEPEDSIENSGAVPNQAIETKPEIAQNVNPGPSNDHGSSSNNDSSPAKPPNKPLRERCMYGANCYRRNPQHKATFSHPGDADWGSGARAPCPWGAACRRTDPRHWRDHDHPPGTQPPAPGNRPGMQHVRRNGNNFYINANAVHFYDDHFEVEDSDGDSVDYDYEF